MAGLKILLLCVSLYGHEVHADRNLQPYGPQMCKELCGRMACSDSKFDEVMLICRIVSSDSIGAAAAKFKLPQRGFLVKTLSKIYFFDDSLDKHITQTTGLLCGLLGHDEGSWYAYQDGQLFVASIKNYTFDFRKDKFIKDLSENVHVQKFELDRKNNVLAILTGSLKRELHVVSLKGSQPKRLVKKDALKFILYIDKPNRLVFYQNNKKYISSIDYRGQTYKKYKRIKKRLIKIEVRAHILTWFICTSNKLTSYKYDMRSKKTIRKKLDVQYQCKEIWYFIRVEDKTVLFSLESEIIVEEGGSSHIVLQDETVVGLWLLK